MGGVFSKQVPRRVRRAFSQGQKKTLAGSVIASIVTLTGVLMMRGGSKLTTEMSQKRYERNPFVEGMVVPVKGQSVKLSKLGKDDNILVNQDTGEIQGTHVTTYKRVDSEQFVKLFTANIALTFDLKSAGIKAFNVLLWAVQNNAISKDQVFLDAHTLNAFLAEYETRIPPVTLSMATLKRGLRELEKAQVIARTLRAGQYFINPNFVFNGDRIAFTTLIERKGIEEEDQQELDLI